MLLYYILARCTPPTSLLSLFSHDGTLMDAEHVHISIENPHLLQITKVKLSSLL